MKCRLSFPLLNSKLHFKVIIFYIEPLLRCTCCSNVLFTLLNFKQLPHEDNQHAGAD